MTPLLTPPICAPAAAAVDLAKLGFAVLDAAGLAQATHGFPSDFDGLRGFWDDLPADAHLRDGGRYRRRRHGCFEVDASGVRAVAHRAHWQPLEYNALHGGFERWFEPIAPALIAQPVWTRLLAGLGAMFDRVRPGAAPWSVEAHLFRIDTAGGIGRPTPEGAHRDGVDFVAVVLVARTGVKGGETRVFDAHGPSGIRFTLSEPWTAVLLDDARVIHESTPIQPVVPGSDGHRDTLVLTYRRGGFQGP